VNLLGFNTNGRGVLLRESASRSLGIEKLGFFLGVRDKDFMYIIRENPPPSLGGGWTLCFVLMCVLWRCQYSWFYEMVSVCTVEERAFSAWGAFA
jgi:hypothetical protein